MDGHTPLNMEVCATRVTLGNTVCAPRENTPLCIRVIRFVIDDGKIASGRNPSIETITTRRTAGANVGVMVGDGVSVGVDVSVGVVVAVSVAVCVGRAVLLGVKDGRTGVGTGVFVIWQASRKRIEQRTNLVLRVR